MGTQAALEQLRLEVAELRASRERLVRASDADRRSIERALHDGVHQHLIGLAVVVQLASASIDADPGGAKALLDQMGHDLEQALGDTVRLARRIYLPQLEGIDLGAALRAAAVAAGNATSIEVSIAASHPHEAVSIVYLCCLEALEGAGAGAKVSVREEHEAVSIAVETTKPWGEAELERLRDRVEALGGGLSAEEIATGARVTATLPLSR